MRATWPDEILEDVGPLTPRAMLERLSWQIRRYEAYLQTPGLDIRAASRVSDKLDQAHGEFRKWYELSEAETRVGQIEALVVALVDRHARLDRYLLQVQEVVIALMDRLDQGEGEAHE